MAKIEIEAADGDNIVVSSDHRTIKQLRDAYNFMRIEYGFMSAEANPSLFTTRSDYDKVCAANPNLMDQIERGTDSNKDTDDKPRPRGFRA